jgi:hypothetical protein
MVDDAKLHQFMGQMLSDLGGAASVALVRIGDALETRYRADIAAGGKNRVEGEKDVAALNTRFASYEVPPENRNRNAACLPPTQDPSLN